MKLYSIPLTPNTAGDYVLAQTPSRISGWAWAGGAPSTWAGTLYGSMDGISWTQATFQSPFQFTRPQTTSIAPYMKFTATSAGSSTMNIYLTEESER